MKYVLNIVLAVFAISSFAQTNSYPTAGNVKIFATDAAWGEGVVIVKPSSWSGIRLTRNDPATGNYTGNWALGYNINTGNDFSFSTFNGAQYDGVLHLSNSTRNVGIGTTSPADQLEVVNGNRKVGLNTTLSGVTNGGVLSLSRPDDGTKVMFFGTSAAPSDDPVIFGNGGSTEMRFVSGGGGSTGFGFYTNISAQAAFASARPTPLFKIDGSGNVGIGTSVPNQKLTVNGTIYGKEVKVDLSVPGPDYVFEKDYNLPSLESVKTYIDQNKHLPEVPSAKEMEANGINLSEMNMLLLKKVEELTLYVIDLKKEVVELKRKESKK